MLNSDAGLQVAEWQAAAAAGGAAPPVRARGTDAGTPASVPAADAEEAAYAAQLAAELAGVPFSSAGAQEPAAPRSAAPRLGADAPGGEAEAEALSHVLLPRKRKELYKAMQMGRAKKEAATGALRARKQAAAAAGGKR